MARFFLHGTGPTMGLVYDNLTSELLHPDGRSAVTVAEFDHETAPPAIARGAPGRKTGAIRTLKIQLGLHCNMACSYCSQRFVPRAAATSMADAEAFLEALPTWWDGGEDGRGKGVKVEFWGGEPFVYFAAMRFLAEGIQARYPGAMMSVITNGTLLDDEKLDWLDRMGFAVAVSHDGPGQATRGPNPFADPAARAQREILVKAYHRLAPKGRFSFNAMLHRDNQSRAEIGAYFREITGNPSVRVGEGAVIDPYDEDGLSLSLRPEDTVQFRRRAYAELRSGAAALMQVSHSRLSDFVFSLMTARPAASLGQKCGMDRPEHLAVTLKGEVVTCQNVSPVATAPNGEPHRLGSIEAIDEVEMTTGTHWSHRPMCRDCPVLQLCRGACLFLEGELWDAACRNAYSDHAPFFAAGIEKLTGFRVERIQPLDSELPADRQWLWQDPPTLERTAADVEPL